MNILITGSTGLIGSSLGTLLVRQNHHIIHAVRKPPASEDQVFWNPGTFTMDSKAFDGVDAVVHLAGESITGGRWTAEKKRRIRESRIRGTRLLSETMAGLSTPPKVFVSTSAVGYYGDRGDEALDEASGPGTGFLADVCREWEDATGPAREKGIRTVILRLGIVLSATGGALARMLPVFRLGLGGKIGGGRQFMSWIALQDLTEIILYVIDTESLHGPVNAVSPNPVTNRKFAKTLSRVLSRPAFFSLPGAAARLAFGEMADALLLASARVLPSRLQAEQYPFRFAHLENALRDTLRNT